MEDPASVGPHGADFLIINAGVLVVGFEALRQKSALIAAAGSARQESARLLQETIDVQARLQSVVDSVRRERQETILPQLLLPDLPVRVPGLDLSVHFEAHPAPTDTATLFFDSFVFGEESTALVVGAVAGAGSASAAAAAMLRYLLRSAVYRCPTLSEAVTELNAMLVSHRLLAKPSRLFVSVYQAPTQTMTSVSCGDIPALMRCADTGLVEALAAVEPLLGASENFQFRERKLQLSPGDLVLLSPGDAVVSEEIPDQAAAKISAAGFSQWKNALENQTAVQDAQGLIFDLVQTKHPSGVPGQSGNICLMAAIVTGDSPEKSA